MRKHSSEAAVFSPLHHHCSSRGLQTSSKDGKNKAIETTAERVE